MQILALLELGLVLLPKITVGVSQFVGWLSTVRTAAQQAEVWTEEHEAAWREGLLMRGLSPEEIPDP